MIQAASAVIAERLIIIENKNLAYRNRFRFTSREIFVIHSYLPSCSKLNLFRSDDFTIQWNPGLKLGFCMIVSTIIESCDSSILVYCKKVSENFDNKSLCHKPIVACIRFLSLLFAKGVNS